MTALFRSIIPLTVAAAMTACVILTILCVTESHSVLQLLVGTSVLFSGALKPRSEGIPAEINNLAGYVVVFGGCILGVVGATQTESFFSFIPIAAGIGNIALYKWRQ